MVRLSCRCLNVTIHVKGSDSPYKKEDPRLLGDLLGSSDREGIKGLALWEVCIDVAGIAVKLKEVVVPVTFDDWCLHKCSSCASYTHLNHKNKTSRVLVTGNLISENIKNMEESCNFSPIFKILLNAASYSLEDNEQPRFRKRVSSLSYGLDDPAMKRIHEDMKSFLQEEQDAMEERIKRFEELQRREYAELQSRAHKERSVIFRLIAKARENAISEAIGDISASRPAPKSPVVRPKPASPRSKRSNNQSPSQSSQHQNQDRKTVTLQDDSEGTAPRVQNKTAQVDQQRRLPQEDDIFSGSMDGFEADRDYTPFSQSDDDSSYTDDSFRDDYSSNGSTHSSTGQVAQSVPVSVPMFRKSPKKSPSSDQQNDDEKSRISIEKMAASIQALALSCQDTGMFGELPKPRINSIPWRH